ncbi:MAG: PfkB family carbohydrate kinase [Actinomycetaceae bacterium]|nr:PfkB family carbohydrate kinase [Actinomycetaceae bacterium]
MTHIDLKSFAPKKRVIVVGAAVLDVVVRVPNLPLPGDDIPATQEYRGVGGCGANVVRALRRLDVPALAALPCGSGPLSQELLHRLKTLGLTSAFQRKEGDIGWSMALVEPNGQRSFVSVGGVEEHWNREELDALDIADNDLLYLSGYEIACPTGQVLVDWFSSLPHTVTLVFDPGPRIRDIPQDRLEALLRPNTIITVNREEASFLCVAPTPQAFKGYLDRFNIDGVLRLDEQGAFTITRDAPITQCPPFEVQVVDTVGAGDGHTAGLLAGLSSGWNLADATVLGNAVAGVVVTKAGGQGAPDLDELNRFLS